MNASSSRWLLLAILAIYFVLATSMLTSGHDWGDDFSAYLMQAQSIVEGDIPSYVAESRFTIERSSITLGPVLYSWGYPVLLVPLYTIFGLNLAVFKLLNLVLYGCFLVCLYVLFDGRLSPWRRLALVALFACSPMMLGALDQVLSDIPFLFFATLSLLWIDRFVYHRHRIVLPAIDSLLLGGSIFAAYSIRPTGIILLLVLLVVQACSLIRVRGHVKCDRDRPLLKPRGESRVMFDGLIPYGVFFALVMLEAFWLYQEPLAYWNQLRQVTPLLILKHLYRYSILPALVFYEMTFQSVAHHLVAIVTIPCAMVGILNHWRKDFHFILYTCLILGIHVVWPYFQGLRFIYPVLPFYVYFVFKGIESTFGSLHRKSWKFASVVELGLIIMIVLIPSLRSAALALENLANRRQIMGPYETASQEMFHFLSTATAEDSVIVFAKPRVLRMMTQRRAYLADECRELVGADYLVLSRGGIARESLHECVGELALGAVFENQGFAVYPLAAH